MTKYLTKSRRTEQTASFLLGTLSATSDEMPIFVAPFNCEITGAWVTDTTGFGAEASNNWTFALKRKGTAGSGTDSIASRTTTAAIAAFVPGSLGTLTNTLITKETSVTITATKNNSAANTDNTIVTIRFREI